MDKLLRMAKALVAFIVPIIIANVKDLDLQEVRTWVIGLLTAIAVWAVPNKK